MQKPRNLITYSCACWDGSSTDAGTAEAADIASQIFGSDISDRVIVGRRSDIDVVSLVGLIAANIEHRELVKTAKFHSRRFQMYCMVTADMH